MIRYQDLTSSRGGDIFEFSAFASDLGFKPGEWPVELPTEVGNKQPFMRASKKLDREGDLQWVTYRQALGCVTLRVLND